MRALEITTDPLAELAGRFRQGDRAAFQELHRQINPGLEAFLAARAKGRVEASDLAQEVWLKAWNAREKWTEGHFRGWIFQIARNRLLDEYRRQGSRPASQMPEEMEIVQRIVDDQSERIDALRGCLEHVGGSFVQVLKLQLEGSSTEEIASLLNISPATVYTKASRGRDELRDCVERKLS
ncbi:MAG: RNA polymerase sigma factor [Planctomycetaceae bacterium]|nr:RNA polymerase sigma factor [Planctomycetaceae bacterium]